MERNRLNSSRDEEPPRRGGRDRDDPPARGGREEVTRGRDRDDPPRGRDRDDPPPRSRDRDDAPRGGSSDRGRDSGRSSSYEYKPRDAAQTRQRAAMGANDFDKIMKSHIKMYKPKDGDNRVRIVPPTWDGADHYGLDIYVNYGVGPDRQSYLSLTKNNPPGKPDPIQEEHARARLELTDSEEDKKYLKQLEAKRRVLMYLVDRDDEKEGVQAWAAPWTVDRDIVQVSDDKSTGEVLNIDDPHEGYDVMFVKKGTKDRTEYTGVTIARRSSPLGKREWMDFAVENPLPDQLVFFDYDHIAKAFGSQGDHRERSQSRGDDRGSDRGGRDRDRDDAPRGRTGRDIDDADRPDRGRDAGTGGTPRNREPDVPTWETVQKMTVRELEDLIDQQKLDIDPREAKDDQDLADWVCETMKLSKAVERDPPRRGRDDADVDDRMAEMRRRRE